MEQKAAARATIVSVSISATSTVVTPDSSRCMILHDLWTLYNTRCGDTCVTSSCSAELKPRRIKRNLSTCPSSAKPPSVCPREYRTSILWYDTSLATPRKHMRTFNNLTVVLENSRDAIRSGARKTSAKSGAKILLWVLFQISVASGTAIVSSDPKAPTCQHEILDIVTLTFVGSTAQCPTLQRMQNTLRGIDVAFACASKSPARGR